MIISISYSTLFIFISILWAISRIFLWLRSKCVNWVRELQLLPVYICIIVIARFVFFPFEKVDGQIQPLIFDAESIWPLSINLQPFAYLFDYALLSEAMRNLIGNILMFVPVGIVFPIVYRSLDTHSKAIGAGICFSLAIELLQLPFSDRVSDIDDLILNTLGYTIGYIIFLGITNFARRYTHKQ